MFLFYIVMLEKLLKAFPSDMLYKSPVPITATPRPQLLLPVQLLLVKENTPLLPRMKPLLVLLSQPELLVPCQPAQLGYLDIIPNQVIFLQDTSTIDNSYNRINKIVTFKKLILIAGCYYTSCFL